MKILLILLLTWTCCFSKTINLSWDANPVTENVTTYFIMVSSATPIKTGDTYTYDIGKFSDITSTQITVSDASVSYITIIAYNGRWGASSSEVKHTPDRVMTNMASIGPNPVTGIVELKFTIFADAGRYISIETSSNLIDWVEYDRIIIGFYDVYVEYIPLTPTNRFFRSRYIPYVPAIMEPLIIIDPPPITIDKPNQKIKKRKNKNENIPRSTFPKHGKHRPIRILPKK